MEDVIIGGAGRSAIGNFGGTLSSLSASDVASQLMHQL
jgi:acetyl-CoA acetyltransferase